MERQVRYCTTEDGVRVAYCVEGEGPPLLVTSIFLESFGMDHLLPAYQEFVKALGQGRCLIRVDGRGGGLSQRKVDDLTYAAFARDLKAVLDAVGVQRTAVWASTVGGPTVLDFTLRHPEIVSALVLYGTFADVGGVFPESTMRSFAHLAETNWDLASQLFADMTGRREYPDEALTLADWYRQSCTGPDAAARILANINFELCGPLSDIRVRTLVIHRVNDPTVPIDAGRNLAAQLPNARFVQLPGNAHAAYLGDFQTIVDAVHEFLDEDTETRRVLQEPARADQVASGFRTVLFTDLVGHTAMMRRLGDVKGRAVLREHETITRNVLKGHGGAEVKTMGDGFMASFGSVTKAVECAIALQQAFAGRNETAGEPLVVRVGLNAGEPIEEDGDLFGETVILAARIAAMAQGGEVLASLAVRELCAGKGFLFADLGEHVMRGFEDPVRVFEIKRPV